MEGFMLGLSSGTLCLAYCSPVLVPYFMTNPRSTPGNFLDLFNFLLGRVGGYLLFAIIAWRAGWMWHINSSAKPVVLGSVYILLAIFLLVYNLGHRDTPCAAKPFLISSKHMLTENKLLAPVILGLLTGINLCPPFLLIFTKVSTLGSITDSIFYFLMFFLGTCLYFLPLPFIGLLPQKTVLQTVGRFTSVIVAFFYIYTGVIELIGGYLIL
jgi:sulfite exporter TauE/SafE